MKDQNVFDFNDYKSYLEAKAGRSGTRKGIKAAMAKALNCQPTYISQIIHNKAHLSLEQADELNHFFGHSQDESFFFMLLVQKDRSGTKKLKEFFQKQIDAATERRLNLSKRLGSKTVLSEIHQSTYYSSWIYAALHIAVTIPELRTREALSQYFKLPIKRITEALDFLVLIELVEHTSQGYQATNSQIRLGNDSKNIIKHHTNWRLQAAESLDREEVTDLHYSGVVSLSQKDVLKIKNILLEAVRESQSVIKESKEEEIFAIGMDFFTLKK